MLQGQCQTGMGWGENRVTNTKKALTHTQEEKKRNENEKGNYKGKQIKKHKQTKRSEKMRTLLFLVRPTIVRCSFCFPQLLSVFFLTFSVT